MKKLIKMFGAVAIIASMAFSMAGCSITDVKDAGDTIMTAVFELEADDITDDYFNEDGKHSGEQKEIFEGIVKAFDKEFALEFEDVKPTAKSINIKNDDATVLYNIAIGDEVYEFELNLVKDDDEWVIADNKDFSVAVTELFLTILEDQGSKSQKAAVEAIKEETGISKTNKLATAIFEEYES